ncbi:protein phosphatase regulator [Coemansia sp. RSA 1813]|nr:protein phosphatase regulator [Coemansia sp. RSA 1646]KAJ1769130.1 protein phosphatase regulator [Coemansia sp. RSA 1843]KAJ2091917.1 protein phosphatase regulator [Coemansia sp. RSA 986]KAJ2212458.1 protein phosphatase regulator [Coemansia sp. RSA 487]KAJ2571688.1 protein phosphatase regulator [Coemansia sp. RSA 1813]
MNFQDLEFDGVPTDPDLITDDNESDSSLVDEDVDYDYVYALFHFPQMVEGQVTVDEGEKLTLLDDSNSYWWLVQNLRDNQMGYIPADNIESAFGKLARVNRRKNMKLCRPDPEHMMNSRQPAVPKPNARNVKFNEKLVTEVFISAPVTEDEYSEDEYDYDYDDDDIEDEPATQTDRHVQAPSQAASVDHDSKQHDDDFGEENDDYNYYYTADAGNDNSYNEHENADEASSAASTPTARRVSIAPMHMGQITGELMDDDNSDSENESAMRAPKAGYDSQADQGVPEKRASTSSTGVAGIYADHRDRRDSSLLMHLTADPAEYYPANEESDEGDSLNGALHRLNDSRASVESAKYTLKIVHTDSFNTTEESISVFPDETFREVLRHSLALFSITDDVEDDLILHAHLQQRELIPLGHDMRVSQLFEILHRKCNVQLPLSSNQISPGLCTVVLADRTLPQGQLLLLSGSSEDDPYMNMESGSRSILRTSIAASITEGISGLAPKGLNDNTNNSEQPSQRASTASTQEDTSGLQQIAPSSSSSSSATNGSSQNTTDNSPQNNQRQVAGNDDLPDSRKVVQGLLRSIPPPKSRPPQSAINKAKRNTVQINALGSIVSNDYQASRSPSQARNTLTRSASTRSPSSATAAASSLNSDSDTPQQFTETVDQVFEAHAELSEQIANTPTEPVVTAVNHPNQALGLSTSTLRPSSDTFTEDYGLSVDISSNNQSNNGQNGDTSNNGDPPSPASSSDTASIQNRDSEDGSVSASAAAVAATAAGAVSVLALSHSNTHQHQKDDGSIERGLANVDTGHENLLATETQNIMFSDGELSLDDWLVVLRGWRDINDMGSNASFYQSILRDMENADNATATSSSSPGHKEAVEYIRSHVAGLDTAKNDAQAAIDDILSVSQGVGRRLDTLERELDDIARILVHAN